MSYETIKERLRAVAFTIATPFDSESLDVQYDALTENVRALENAGASLYIPCGNTGEYDSLTHSERVSVVGTTVDATGDDSTVIGGAGGSTRTVTQLVDEYESVGADGVMIMTPTHTYLHERGVRRYYRTIADATDLPLVLYKRGPALDDEVIADLSHIENVVGVKYAVNDVDAFSKAVAAVDGDLVWLNGIAERFAPSFALEGAEGFTTGIGNFVPKPTLALMDALENEQWERAKSIREALRPYEDLREECGPDGRYTAANNVPAVKYGMELAGLNGGVPRDPLVVLADEDKERARQYYERITARFETAPFA